MLVIDKYAYTNRIVGWSPQRKAMFWLLGMVIAFQPLLWLKPILLVLVAWNTMYLTQVSFHQYLKWFYAIIPFLLLSIVGIVFTVSHDARTIYGPVHLFNLYWGVSRSMLPQALRITLQALTAIVCTYWFALTTPFQQIIAFLKWLHLPNILIEETMLMYRFIFIFVEAFEQIHQAQKLRFGYDNIRLMIHSSGILAKMLFEQVMVNYQNMTYALDAKLYDGEFYVKGREKK
ncbi:cobalt ECF transporter T component CbiQ [Levilactobacillus yiduensis]|uniref:cobalt ECF transporter T component CbiQ n=1 Tax=Levilactobacillus yiduensis TaxID=2953880 RepID=UPI000EF2D71D|nr:cobalt ECF transporter T component CbiQ [Levilactobacillus yiduensis]AYM02466.1 cobalt ECF transporter T component CbiQ [Levilactobacillus brevis]